MVTVWKGLGTCWPKNAKISQNFSSDFSKILCHDMHSKRSNSNCSCIFQHKFDYA